LTKTKPDISISFVQNFSLFCCNSAKNVTLFLLFILYPYFLIIFEIYFLCVNFSGNGKWEIVRIIFVF
jgi:hypothetical protein